LKNFEFEEFKLVKEIYGLEVIPEDFQKSIIIQIPKKATADKCDDFRTLSLMTQAAKILVKIIC